MKTNRFLSAVVFTAISFTFLACSSGGGSGSGGYTYSCQFPNTCIQVESLSNCTAAGGDPVDYCPGSGGGSSPSSGNCGSYSGGNGSFICGGQTYKTVVIGTQTWMAENLNYNVSGSKCYDNEIANCTIYGRLYDWATAMNLPGCNSSICSGSVQSKHQGICPSGWHIPSRDEWTTLIDYAGDSTEAGKHLKATSGWDDYGNGEDKYGFAALPGGNGYSDGSFDFVGYFGYWWSASESYAGYAYLRYMSYSYEYVSTINYNKSYLFSVRCLQD